VLLWCNLDNLGRLVVALTCERLDSGDDIVNQGLVSFDANGGIIGVLTWEANGTGKITSIV